ncbi:transcription factor PCL1 [Panicum miliaceum]|uniref:Transcription factor PCL1 n=1 Tax=Panicum miliaceum TaxID=4540 RepID=A0A3L6PSR0_PANMI|nr:transcription factor PCL1 [Panicum miliaceum]
MGEEAVDDYDLHLLGVGDDERVMEWETGLPGADELTPLSQPLVPPGLAAAFRIPPEPGRTLLDVHRASAATVSRLRRASSSESFQPFLAQHQHQQRPAADSSAATNSTSKRPRLVWTPQLHKRFVDVVAHLGIKNAGLSNEGPSPSDHIFASTPVPHSLVHEPQAQVPAPPMYHHSIPMPMGVAAGGMVPSNNSGAGYGYGYGYHHHHQQQQAYHHHHHRAGDK